MNRIQLTFSTILSLGIAVAASAAGETDWWTGSHPSNAVTAIVEETNVTAGKYTLVDDAALGHKVLAADKEGVTLSSRASYTGPQELRARVRLCTSNATPAAYATFRLARTSRPESELVFSMGASKPTETVSCSAPRAASR